MEPRARAGKNVGKETFQPKDVSRLLFAYGDVEAPLPESVRVLDEIVTEFLEGVCFEASRHAQVAGRQKLKFDDFEFALRRSPTYLGKVRSMIDKRQHIATMRNLFKENDDDLISQEKDKDGKATTGTKRAAGSGVGATAGSGAAPAPADEELLGLSDDDGEVMSALTSTTKGGSRKKRKKDGGK
ncbi:putative transcription initiation factor tfiid subunit protein [Eutypa lata UCREL1]|uniref:Transcription initiation factor TFIID subunit 13 n=1 Tax=Eutypa lata (strain UCR-EL1) TaxID=1287681 RepID=M7TJG5_EUTLA|nr:putative transcription initiation factor tfiid subunit protein [Eutypa lata UCREL1]